MNSKKRAWFKKEIPKEQQFTEKERVTPCTTHDMERFERKSTWVRKEEVKIRVKGTTISDTLPANALDISSATINDSLMVPKDRRL